MMSALSSAWVCESNADHYLSLVEWAEWVQGKRSTDTVMQLLSHRTRYETCVICGLPTPYHPSTPVGDRYGYVEGAGQLCSVCFDSTSTVEDRRAGSGGRSG